MSRSCIFCGTTGRLSREHVFPNWLNELYPNDDVGDTEVLRRLVVDSEVQPDRRYTKRDVASQTTAFVCRKCNQGWMSQLEAEAKPLISALALGQRRQLDLKDQLLLATWAVKTFQVVETIWGQELLALPEDRELMFTERRPPARYRVWALAYTGPIGPLRSTVHGAQVSERSNGRDVGRAFLATFQIGTLVVQVGGGDPATPVGGGLERYGSVSDRRLQVFPSVPKLSWPPAVILDDAAFMAATQELGVLDPQIPSLNVPGIDDLPGGGSPAR